MTRLGAIDFRSMALPYLLFAVSGFASLLYEIVWTRRLVLVFGGTVYSVSTVLVGFMAGFALGSYFGSFLAKRAKHPWRLYGCLELGIALAAAFFPVEVHGIFALIEGGASLGQAGRCALTLLTLLPATFLMGATFPVLSQHVARRNTAREVGALYAANLVGACLGTLGSAFILVAILGLQGTQYFGLCLNLAVGALVLLIPAKEFPGVKQASSRKLVSSWLNATVFASGLCGMAFEVVWTRILIPSFNNSVYGFASMLSVFLAGLGIGSFIAGRMSLKGRRALGALLASSAVAASAGYLAFYVSQLLQIRFASMAGSGVRPLLIIPFLEACAVLGPLAVFQGMVFPVALRSSAEESAGVATGRLYFWNTLGGIVGALAAGFYWLPKYNVQNGLLIVIAISLLAGSVLMAASMRRRVVGLAVPAAAVLLLAGAWLGLSRRHLPSEILMRWIARSHGPHSDLLYYRDDVEASVAAIRDSDGSRFLVINGVGVSGYTNATKMLAHIPLLLHPNPQRTLVICFGLGTTFRAAMHHPGVVEAVDIVPAVFQTMNSFFPDAHAWLSHPRARLFADDGRNHLLADHDGYDVIIVDPSPPLYAAGTVNIYSKDFFELGRRRLSSGGIMTVWLPGYPESEFKMVMKSFLSVFPSVQIWRASGSTTGIAMLGSDQPILLDHERVRRRRQDPEIRRDMLEFNPEFKDESSFWDLYVGSGEQFQGYLKGTAEVTDDYPWIEYPYFRAMKADYYRPPEIFSWPKFLVAGDRWSRMVARRN